MQEEEWEGEWEGDYVYGRGEGGGGMGNYTIFVTTVIFKLAIVIYNRYNEYCHKCNILVLVCPCPHPQVRSLASAPCAGRD